MAACIKKCFLVQQSYKKDHDYILVIYIKGMLVCPPVCCMFAYAVTPLLVMISTLFRARLLMACGVTTAKR